MTALDTQHSSEYGVAAEAGTVRFERLLPGPIERVWAYLTESDRRAQWFAGGTMELHAGGRVAFVFHNSTLAPHEPMPEPYAQYEGHASTGRVTRCEPPRVLSFIWHGDSGDDEEVTFELTSRGADVLLVLTHRRLRDRAAMADVAGGWHAHLGVLADRLSGREPHAFWSTVTRVGAEYQQRFADASTPESTR